MESQLKLLNDKGVFSAESAVLNMRLKVKLIKYARQNNIRYISKRLLKITAPFGMSPKFDEGFYVVNDSVNIAILNDLSDELNKMNEKKVIE
ncbi:hypothetical protein [Pseudomonas coronafaciens]|uniref:hypothetical protein n=1 Tax=Pseudomonas coronafaciens TaxID=53409 RepID=UPI000EFFCE7E|nr:hypothetical protein [Pseudomonas coronafaciens]